ncbi:uncharacterized protein KY384_006681 [Bacidia gigantensis]|uniref:uncharacterized protein n=1 Tax=Bacidia gigantensis TaxID=2732470 RepID=UPI001D05294B|nr:uncharacterized protein KY384_006681 [Bacidia gigantensis]KAG8528992.1 hypothetical protein KY384_006681 [Bacidia gigantensis]
MDSLTLKLLTKETRRRRENKLQSAPSDLQHSLETKFTSLAEERIVSEYSKFLSIDCTQHLSRFDHADLSRPDDWANVASVLVGESEILEKDQGHYWLDSERFPIKRRAEYPWMDIIVKAAPKLSCPPQIIVCQIKAYADNITQNRRLQEWIDIARWSLLAKTMAHDWDTLNTALNRDVKVTEELTICDLVNRAQKEWLNEILSAGLLESDSRVTS